MAHNTKYRPLAHCLLIINIEMILEIWRSPKTYVSAAQRRVCPHSHPWSLACPHPPLIAYHTSSSPDHPHPHPHLLATQTLASRPSSAHTCTSVRSLSSKPRTDQLIPWFDIYVLSVHKIGATASLHTSLHVGYNVFKIVMPLAYVVLSA
jgi:hypothetical protein